MCLVGRATLLHTGINKQISHVFTITSKTVNSCDDKTMIDRHGN